MRSFGDMGIGELIGIIARSSEGESRQRALAAALTSLIEVEIEWRLDLRHQNVGFHKISAIGSMGEGRGEMTGAVDHVGEAAERYRYECRWRSMAKALLAHLNERQRMAVLLTGYAIDDHDRRGRSVAATGIERHEQILSGDRYMTLAEACDAQLVILKRLGWAGMAGYGAGDWVPVVHKRWNMGPVRFDVRRQRELMRGLRPGEQVPFRTMKALRDTAWRARCKLLPVVSNQALLAV